MKQLIFSLSILLFGSLFTYGEKIEVEKTYNETYTVDSQSKFSIDNKYGDITIANWDKNEINIDLKIKVTAKNKAIADQYLNLITAEIKQIDDLVSVKTIFDDNFETKNNVEIDIKYIVKAPASLSYNISNKYGNIAISKITGPTAIHLKYGNLLAKNLEFSKSSPLNTFDFSYSNATLNYCNYAKINIKYGKLKILKGIAIETEAKYSDVTIGVLETLYFVGKYGGLDIDSVEISKIEAKYLNVDIQYLSMKLESDIKYGNLKVNNVTPNFTSIDIISSYGNANLLIHPDAIYEIDAKVEYGTITIPKKSNVNKIIGNTEEKVNGVVGPKGGKVKSKVNINMDYGNISL